MNTLAYRQEVMRQMIFVSSILAGFSFTVVVQLLLSVNTSKRVTWSLRAFIASTSILLITTVGGAILLFASNVLNIRSTEGMVSGMSALFGFLAILFVLGLMTFMVGVSISAWIHSRAAGMFAVILSLLSCVIMSGFYVITVLIFAP